MRNICKVLCVFVLGFFVASCNANLKGENQEPTSIGMGNFTYVGAFNVPKLQNIEGATFSYSGSGVAYNPSNNSLFIVGHTHHQKVGEISIPEPEINSDVTQLPTAELLQPIVDITDGHLPEVGENSEAYSGIRIGGLLVYNNELYGTAYAYYSHVDKAKRSHFKTSIDLSRKDDFTGMYTLGELNPGKTGGYMSIIPPNKRKLFNATAISGNATLCIIGRSSCGPSVSTFSPEDMKDEVVIPSSPLVYYPQNNQTLGSWGNDEYANPVFNMATAVNDVVYPDNFPFVLFFGKTGLGIPEYGAGTADPDMDGIKLDGYNEHYVYDPVDPNSKGPHAWPYTNYVWAYDEKDLLAVYNKEKEPWEILPAYHWEMELPYTSDMTSCSLSGVGYDPDKDRLYIALRNTNGSNPVILVYELKP